MSVQHPVLIGIVGGGHESPETLALARAVGRLVAERGALLLCGGLGGVMEAASRGAVEAEGQTVGILPGTDSRQANAHVTVPLATGMGEARNAIIATAAHGLISIGGEWGTLSEVSLARKQGKPVVSVSPHWQPLPEITVATSPAEAVDLLWKLLGITPDGTN